jgi:hypothetical protein
VSAVEELLAYSRLKTTGLETKVWISRPGMVKSFLYVVQTGFRGPPSLLSNGYLCTSPGVEATGAKLMPPTSADVKKSLSVHPLPFPVRLHGVELN